MVYTLHRYAYLCRKYFPFLSKLITFFVRVFFGCDLPQTTQVGGGTIFAHGGLGCVIHRKSVIGENCIIFQNVTLGSSFRGHKSIDDYPIIGNNVMVGAGAVIIGGVKVGDNATIGANAVVTNDIPAGSTVVGVPAHLLKKIL